MSTAKVTEIEGVDTSKIENFPLSALKVVGGIQIGLGGICIALGLVDILLYVFEDGGDTVSSTGNTAEDEDLATLRSLTISSAPIWCGLWFCVAGAMATCMSERNKATLGYFKITFLILSLLNAAIFGPVCLIITTVIAVIRHDMQASTYRWLIPILTAFFSFNEIVFAILSSAISCCCATLKTSRVRVLLATQKEDSKIFSVSRKTTPDKNNQTSKKNEMIYEKEVPEKQHRNNLKTDKPQEKVPKKNDPDEEDLFTCGEHERPNTKGSLSSYARLKRLVLPSNEPLSTF